ncbi:MAG: heavy-metal-associated domain-containing protein, partial [Ignavibacteria bacterium]|nr:heavy-metal-associated domain-containing protein [Ignavibacteria bacterium]
MKKKIFKTISTIGIMLFTVTLIFGCGKKESTENQNDKQQMNQNQNMDKNMSQNTDKNMNQNMDKSTDKSLDKNMNTSTDKSAEHIMIKLPSMQCKICKKNIERAVNKVPGIIDVNVVVD